MTAFGATSLFVTPSAKVGSPPYFVVRRAEREWPVRGQAVWKRPEIAVSVDEKTAEKVGVALFDPLPRLILRAG
jgi:hypothetical protein